MNLELESNAQSKALGKAISKAQEGLVLCETQDWEGAAACFETALQLDPTHAPTWNNLGNVRDELGDSAAAVAAYQEALKLDPNYSHAQSNLAITAHKAGVAAYAEGHLALALRMFEWAATTVPSSSKACADYDHSYLQLLLETCTHSKVSQQVATMQTRFETTQHYRLHPYPLLAAVDAPLWHKEAAKRHAIRLSEEAGVVMAAPRPASQINPRRSSERIRIAYLSSDWHQHPVPQQLLACIEAHDRSAFEVIGVATDAVSDATPWRVRIERAFDQFYALGHLSDAAIAEQLRSLEIDIAIDLSLYMEGGRPLILAARPCAWQVAFLGYAGTSGAPWIDYFIADDVTVPPAYEALYSESILKIAAGAITSCMPDNDQRAPVVVPRDRAKNRLEQGLPKDAFVFCAFSNPYKITPQMLDLWFAVLHQTPKSVLWLQANNEIAQNNLSAAAQAAGLAHDRLIFAKRWDSFDAHLQRYALADLFLDSYPYNAHVTAADALWAGLPVLTLQGESYASRVASSILTALSVPELITQSANDYAATALDLARHPTRLAHLQIKIKSATARASYFDQKRYIQQLERTYATIYDRQDEKRATTAVTVPQQTSITTAQKFKLIAFSLWGDNPSYLIGALRNAQLAAVHYPDWVCRFYCANDVAPAILQRLQSYPNVQVVLMPPAPDRLGAFWRFMAAEDEQASHIIFRDTDSRLGAREAAAVSEWLHSGQPFHLMRDHPFHWPPIMAGMWGCKGGTLLGWNSLLNAQQPSGAYGSDQAFLADRVYPAIKQHCWIHDACQLSEPDLMPHPFPTPREALDFVGQSYDEHDQPNLYYEQELANWLSL